mgnify:CR=1 FL=1
MMARRGYEVEVTDENFIIAVKPDGEQVVAFFSPYPKLIVKHIQMYIVDMRQLDVDHAIIVYKDVVTSFTLSLISKLTDFTFELFATRDLQYNITTHVLQPKFERVKGAEHHVLMEKYGNKLSKLLREDPIARFYHFQKGDIIRVTRRTGFVTYRITQ